MSSSLNESSDDSSALQSRPVLAAVLLFFAVGFAVDLGVAFQGEPDVQLSASGPIASLPQFQADLAQEEQNIQEDAKPFRFYPVLSLALVFGF